MLKWISRVLILAGLCFVMFFIYEYYTTQQNEKEALTEAKEAIRDKDHQVDLEHYEPQTGESFGVLEVPKLNKSLPIIEGTDPDSLDRGVGHMDVSVFPGQGEQIILSGHRDTVFRQFSELDIGDEFVVEMEYGTFTYEIRDTEIVDWDDTSVVRKMGEEALVVSTCYPFHYVGNAPERFVFYAYPVQENDE